jgi:hypothetical protein
MSNSLGEAVLDLTADKTPMMKDIEGAKPGVLAALDGLGKAGGALLAAGISIAATAIIGITAMIWDAGNTIDAAYDRIQIGTGATGALLQQLKDDFDAVYTSVPANAEDAAAAIDILNTRLGISGPVMQDTAANLLEMTRMLGGDLQTNAESFTRLVGDWGIENENLSGTLDAVFVASQNTAVGTDRLMQLVVQFGAPMRQFGFSFEESIGLLGKWEKEGVNTELVMGSLRIAAGKFARENVPLRDGLEATFESIKNATSESEALAIAMDVFGARAGPDMSAAIRENRFDLGEFIETLEESDGAISKNAEATMDWGERWTLFKNRITSALGPGGMGLMESVNLALVAVEDLFKREEVQRGLTAVVDGIVMLAQNAAAYLPVVIDGFFKFVEFLTNNQGVVVAALAAIGAAIAAFVYTTVIPAAVAAITAVWPVIAIVAAVAAAAYLLYEAWTNNWGGIQEIVASVWAYLQPILQNIWNWLSTNIPLALQTLSAYWSNTLLPAIMAVWSWMSGTLWPFLQALGNFIGAVLGVALRAFAGIWQNVLQPALAAVFGVLSDKLMPIFQTLANFWRSTLQPILQSIANFVGNVVVGAFNSLTKTLQNLTTWLSTVASKLNSMSLPGWMTPGSPTPWEIGLLGVNDALKKVSGIGLPRLSANLNAMPAPVLSGGMALNGAGGGSSVQFVYQPFVGVNDEYEAEQKLRGIIDRIERRKRNQ